MEKKIWHSRPFQYSNYESLRWINVLMHQEADLVFWQVSLLAYVTTALQNAGWIKILKYLLLT